MKVKYLDVILLFVVYTLDYLRIMSVETSLPNWWLEIDHNDLQDQDRTLLWHCVYLEQTRIHLVGSQPQEMFEWLTL